MISFARQILPKSFLERYRSQLSQLLDLIIVLARVQRCFVRPALPKLADKTINLHLGCGEINHPKFVNIDLLPASHIHYIRPVDNLAPFKENSVDLIYSSHCLEHFSHRQVSLVLREWFRVLKPGGICRISVPDFDNLLEIYQATGKEMNAIQEILMGGQNYKFNWHFTAFNQSSLEQLFKSAGFQEVRQWQAGSSELTTFDDWSAKSKTINGKKYPISLNLEALK